MADRKKLCRYVIIHGFCKHEHSGCEFSHDTSAARQTLPASSSPDLKTRLRVDSPVFTPSPSKTTISSESVNVAPFVPLASNNSTIGVGGIQNPVSYDRNESPFVSSSSQQDGMYSYYPESQDNINTFIPASHDHINSGMNAMSLGDSAVRQATNFYQPEQDPYFYQTRQPEQQLNMSYTNQPLQYHLYLAPLPHVSNLHPHQKTIHSFFMSDRLREELQRRCEVSVQSIDPETAEANRIPLELHGYHSFYPLDEHTDKSTKIFGLPTWVYKATSSVDGKLYILRRIEGFRLLNEAAMASIEGWRRIRHAGIVSVREAFTTKAFGDYSLVFVYDYHPLSVTMFAKHFQPGIPNASLPEKTIWSFITQIASAIKTIHSSGLACRVLEPSKILVTGKNRIRLNCCGIFDMLTFDGGKNVTHFQQDDLLQFGQILVALACGSLASIHNLPKSIDFISRHYSLDLKNVIIYLLSKPSNFKTIDDVVTMIGPRILHEINSAHHYNDLLENELAKETENGRIVRLMSKLGFINERPELGMDPSWAETGDRYLLKLFRDYVFHQVDEMGRPVVDMVHVLQCLNKLDAGIDEKIMLMSRDEQSCLIVSYKELKHCIDTSFQQLL